MNVTTLFELCLECNRPDSIVKLFHWQFTYYVNCLDYKWYTKNFGFCLKE